MSPANGEGLPVYSVDTSGLIDGLERFYPIGNFPALWERIDELAAEGRFFFSEEVLHESKRVDAPLKEWCKGREGLAIATDADIAAAVGVIATDYPSWFAAGKNGADPFVIATAETRGAIVVTGEKGGSVNNPKIPFVCDQRGIECINFTQVIIRENWSFG